MRIGVHTRPGNDFDSTHSADVDYAELLPNLLGLKAGNFYIALAGEPDRRHVLKIIRKYLKAYQRIFVGVIAPIDNTLRPQNKCETVRSNLARIGAGARKTVNF
jgi:5-methyltetrahydropteroyltriglutamate--homocysteine methyltransferase